TAIMAGNGLTTRYLYWGLDNFAPGYPNFAYGRLRQICVTSSNCALGYYTGTLLNLAYNYDHVGNVITLRDDTGGQREDFTYDALDRLTGAVPNPLGVPQTIGDYTETYGYNVIGNLVSKAGVALTYTSTKPHAVTALSNGATFVYDGNGNMTQRVEVSTTQRVTYTQVWDVNNRLQAVLQDQASVHFAYDAAGLRAHKTEYAHGAALFSDTFDVANSAAWTFGPSSTVPFAGDGNPVWRNLGAEAYRESWRNSYNLVNGDSASVDFRVNAANTYLYLMLESDRNGPNHSRWAVFAHDNRLSVQYRLNGGDWLYQWGLLNPLKTNTWYRLTLRVDEANGFRIEVRERDGCSSTGACGASYSNFMPAGKSWRFSTAIYRGESWLDNYVERNDRTAQVRSISPAYEYLLAGGVVTRTFYYTFGGTRVAMRVFTSWPGTLYWLHGDHLGSASLTTNSSGQPIAQLRYSPFGETRWANPSASATPTDRRFTGQRQENAGAVGSLYDYGARVYSPLLGRFLSADSLVPQPGDPQSLNRYSYALDNPLKYTDPTGHDVACAGRDASECGTGGGATPSWTDMYQSSVTGIRVPQLQQIVQSTQPGTYLAPRDGYQSAIAANYASQGYVHWAELIEVGHLCAACHVTHNDGSIPTDEELDLSTYNFWAKESALETSAIGVVTSLGSSYVSLRASARLNPNAIGRWGEQQVGQELPVEVRQIRVVDKMTGQVRIYDGQFVAVEGAYVEVKTSVRGVVTLRPEIRAEIAFDANMAEKPMWIFVNARPSSGVMGALQQAGVPWHVLHVR
ncbi:MAG: RHS repeat-associated core domain-containing protein, partial [Chloroflexi bacterium]|nr:RHS repeat-associated core domain-containing protein [Chloroflexota bacterium]